MTLQDQFKMIAAVFAGIPLGSYLFLTLLHRPVMLRLLDEAQRLLVYRRMYRLNTVFCILAGLVAALLKNNQSALMFSVLAASYVFANAHLLKHLQQLCFEVKNDDTTSLIWKLKLAQNGLHFLQFSGVIYAVYYLIK